MQLNQSFDVEMRIRISNEYPWVLKKTSMMGWELVWEFSWIEVMIHELSVWSIDDWHYKILNLWGQQKSSL